MSGPVQKDRSFTIGTAAGFPYAFLGDRCQLVRANRNYVLVGRGTGLLLRTVIFERALVRLATAVLPEATRNEVPKGA